MPGEIAGHCFFPRTVSRERAFRALTSGSTFSPRDFASSGVLLREAFADLSQQRIFSGLPPDAQVIAERIGEGGGFQTLAHAALVVVNVWEVSVGYGVVHQQLEGFAAPLDATVKL